MAIIDILFLGEDGVKLVRDRYQSCVMLNLSNTCQAHQRYRIIIPDEYEESYYSFLVDNCIGMSSINFLSRVESDRKFADRMRARIARSIESLGDS